MKEPDELPRVANCSRAELLGKSGTFDTARALLNSTPRDTELGLIKQRQRQRRHGCKIDPLGSTRENGLSHRVRR